MQTAQITKLRKIRLVATDVDGVLTDGLVWYSSIGEEIKSFHIQDGLGIKLLQSCGIQVAIITGRSSAMVERRAKELGITHLVQGREDKLEALTGLCSQLDIPLEACAYVGDDLPDLRAIIACGFGIAVANAHYAVSKSADYLCQRRGGDAALREVCDLILEARGELTDILSSYGAT